MESISEVTTESIVLLPSSKPCSSCLYICSFIWLLTLAHLVGIAPSCTEGMQEQTKAPSQQASNPVIPPVAMVDDAVIPSSNLIGKKAIDLSFLDEGLLATINNHCQTLAQLSSEKHVAQGCLDLFRSAQGTGIMEILTRRGVFEELEETLTGLVSVIRTQGESTLADHLSAHIGLIASLLSRLNRLRCSDRGALSTELAASYIQARDQERARLEL